MKSNIQDWDMAPISWQDGVHTVLTTRGDLVVGNIKQSKLFHYVEKNFLTEKIIRRLEELADGKKNTTD
jgi:glutathionylspermidine synthase